jgi:hypothetical protein
MSWLSAAGSGIIGTLTSTLAGHWSAKQNAKIARDQWAYMQSNAHQLEVQDLKNAGLNPILSASNSQMASMPQVSDNGAAGASANILSSALQANVARENAKLAAETEGQHIDNERKRLELDKERYSFQNRLDESQIGLNTSAKALNDANVLYVNQQTSSLRDMTKAQIEQIKQDIQNSVEQTKALVEKYGAESQQARASAALAYKQIQTEAAKAALYLSQKTHEDWDSNRIIRELSDPDSNLHRDYRNTPFGTILGYIGEGIKDLIPFRFGLGVRK